jgi:hypothetical protein
MFVLASKHQLVLCSVPSDRPLQNSDQIACGPLA